MNGSGSAGVASIETAPSIASSSADWIGRRAVDLAGEADW
jgi:hypothetical protein